MIYGFNISVSVMTIPCVRSLDCTQTYLLSKLGTRNSANEVQIPFPLQLTAGSENLLLSKKNMINV